MTASHAIQVVLVILALHMSRLTRVSWVWPGEDDCVSGHGWPSARSTLVVAIIRSFQVA